MRYFISDCTADDGSIEITESEFIALFGDATTGHYATCVYNGEIAIEEVPEDIRNIVAQIVVAKVKRWGKHDEQEISSDEFKSMIKEASNITREQAKSFVNALYILRDSATDAQASMAVAIYPKLNADNALIKSGTRINWNGILKRAAVDLWDTTENNPDNAPSLWEDINYKDGYRIIPQTITVGTAFAKDECGWWGDTLYKSLLDANVYTPVEYPAGWEVVE